MNYLVLFLAPSIGECAVTVVLFFVHFRSPALSATAFISFVAYTVLTVQITQWRKKFRTGQNKQDNKYHDIATDSLVNFETVKYFANEVPLSTHVDERGHPPRKDEPLSPSLSLSLSLPLSPSLPPSLSSRLAGCIPLTALRSYWPTISPRLDLLQDLEISQFKAAVQKFQSYNLSLIHI